MSLEDLENQYREAFTETLNHLQTVTLLVAQIEAQMDLVRDCMQSLYRLNENLTTRKKRLINRQSKKIIYVFKSRNSS